MVKLQKKQFYLIQAVLLGITKYGKWLSADSYGNTVKSLEGADNSTGVFVGPQVIKDLNSCDIIVPALHGPYGEDGVMQGFLEVLGKSYIGCGHHSSSLSMHKGYAKALMQSNGISTLPFVTVSKRNRDADVSTTTGRTALRPVWTREPVAIAKIMMVAILRAAFGRGIQPSRIVRTVTALQMWRTGRSIAAPRARPKKTMVVQNGTVRIARDRSTG